MGPRRMSALRFSVRPCVRCTVFICGVTIVAMSLSTEDSLRMPPPRNTSCLRTLEVSQAPVLMRPSSYKVSSDDEGDQVRILRDASQQ